MKIYNDTDVNTALRSRLRLIFREFKKVLISVSGGKDSVLLVQVANDIAKEMGKTYSVLHLDQECISGYTVKCVNKLKGLSNCEHFFHICLPFEEDNAVSVFSPQWIMWDDDIKDKWVRSMPEDSINEANHQFSFFRKGMSDLEFYPLFSAWFADGAKTANIIGLRSLESLNRTRVIIRNNIQRYNGLNYSVVESENVVKMYPIYDWEIGDIWKCTFDNGYIYNELYELMTKEGIPFSRQRICQPFGLEQRQGLDLFAKFEPELWDKLLNRVSGANFGALYARTEMLGHLKTSKPKHMSWEQYAVFLLESIGLQYPEIEEQYREKIITTLEYHRKQYDQLPTDSDERKGKEYISWREIARAIEKNDFWMKRLSFAETKAGYERLDKIKQKYFDLL